MRYLRLGGVLLALMQSSPPFAASLQRWTSYTNDRFGTFVEVPADFAMQPAPENNDGRTFTSSDGRSRILVYGSYAPSTVVESFRAYRDWVRDDERNDGSKLTYDAAGTGWFAFSGARDGKIFYVKVIAGCRDTSLAHHVRIEYPATMRVSFDPIVTHVSRSLRHSSAIGC